MAQTIKVNAYKINGLDTQPKPVGFPVASSIFKKAPSGLKSNFGVPLYGIVELKKQGLNVLQPDQYAVVETVEQLTNLANEDDGGGAGASFPYLVYTAFLSFNGSAVTASVLHNTIGTDLEWVKPNATNGIFRATAQSGSPFTANKTELISGVLRVDALWYLYTGNRFFASPNNTMQLNIALPDGSQTGTPSFSNLFVEIRIYP